MNILVTFDNNYLEPALNMLLSLKRYNDDLIIHIIYNNLSEQSLIKIKEFVNKYNIGKLKLYYYGTSDKNLSTIRTNYITDSCYLRMYAPFIIEDVDRILYLDPDIICQGSLKDLYNIDLENKAMAACENMLREDVSFLRELMLEHLIMPSDAIYVNSGVLLIDTNKYKEYVSKTQLDNFLKDKSCFLDYHDQDAINYLFYNKIKIVDNNYNYQINAVDKGKEDLDKIIIHYSEATKPWKKDYPWPKKAIPYYKLLQYKGENDLLNDLIIFHKSCE